MNYSHIHFKRMDRNPSPPPEITENMKENDFYNIGDTVFSQHWLFQILLKIIKSVETEIASDEGNDTSSQVLELDNELEQEICTLWDMSVDSDVAHFLVEFKARDLFLEVIEKTKSPRLLEIVLGILANIGYYDDICQHFTVKDEFLLTILHLLSSSDTPTLIQVLRVLRVSIANNTTRSAWLNKLKSDESFLNSLKFMLENSLSGNLLKSAFQLFYDILDKDESFILVVGNESYVSAFTVAASQVMVLNDTEALDEYWLILHLLIQTDSCQDTAISEKLSKTIMNHNKCYLDHFPRMDDVLPSPHRIPGLTAAIATLNAMLTFSSQGLSSEIKALKNMGIIDYLTKLRDSVRRVVSVSKATQNTNNEQMEILFDILNSTFQFMPID